MKNPLFLIFLFLLMQSFGCGRISVEKWLAGNTATDEPTEVDSVPLVDSADTGDTMDTRTDAEADDTETGTVVGSDMSTDTDSRTDGDDTSDSDSQTTTEPEDTEPGTDTSPVDTDSVTEPGTDTVADTETTKECPVLPDGTALLSNTDAQNFDVYGVLGTVSLESVTGQSFANAWHVENGYYSGDAASGQLYHLIDEDIAEGDHVVLEFWSRCISSSSGECHVGALVEKASSPWTNGVSYYATVGSEWTFYQVPFVATTDFTANDTQVGFRLGYADQIIELFPVQLISYGQLEGVARPECLPDTTTLYNALSFGNLPATTAFVDLEYAFDIEVNGEPTPTITVTGLPSWLSFSSTSNLVSGVPTYADVGTTSVITIQADNVNGSISHQFAIDVVVDPALLGHWPMDESGGATAADASGNGRDGTVSGDPTWQPSDGQVGGSLYCDCYTGALDYVTLPSDTEMDNVQYDAYTLSAWVRVESVPPGTGNDAAYGILLKKGRHTGLWYNNTEQFFGSHHYNSVLYEIPTEVVSPGAFHHLAAVMDPDNLSYMLLLDGEIIDVLTLAGDDPLFDFGANPWRIGLAVPDAVEYGWYGDLSVDDVRIYSRALTLHEIQTLASSN